MQTPLFWAENNIWDQKAKERHQDESKKKEYIVEIFALFKQTFDSAEKSPDLKQRKNFFKSKKEWFSKQETRFHSPGMEAAGKLEAGGDSDAMDDSDGDLCDIKDWDGSPETDSGDSCSQDGNVDDADDAAGNSDGSVVVRSEVTAVLGHVTEQQEQIQS